jgi:hypothetical protein
VRVVSRSTGAVIATSGSRGRSGTVRTVSSAWADHRSIAARCWSISCSIAARRARRSRLTSSRSACIRAMRCSARAISSRAMTVRATPPRVSTSRPRPWSAVRTVSRRRPRGGHRARPPAGECPLDRAGGDDVEPGLVAVAAERRVAPLAVELVRRLGHDPDRSGHRARPRMAAAPRAFARRDADVAGDGVVERGLAGAAALSGRDAAAFWPRVTRARCRARRVPRRDGVRAGFRRPWASRRRGAGLTSRHRPGSRRDARRWR